MRVEYEKHGKHLEIKGADGAVYEISVQVYEVTEDYYIVQGRCMVLEKGALVRLIFGARHRVLYGIPDGQRDSKHFATVCHVDAKIAQFIGIPKNLLSPVQVTSPPIVCV